MFNDIPMNPAMEQVFALPELLEMILLTLGDIDSRSLLLSQSTCRTFAATIKHSNRIQRLLWFQPELKHNLPKLPDGVVDINPLLGDCRSLKRGVVPFGAGIRAKAATCYDEPTLYAICRLDRLIAESKGESWRDMIIARMPGRKFRVWLWCYEGLDWDDVEMEVENELKADEMVEKALNALKAKQDVDKKILGKLMMSHGARRICVK